MAKQTIIVDGGYQPNTVTFKQGKPAELTFKRVSDRGCVQVVQSKDFGFKKELPLNEEVTFNIDTSKPGEYGFACGMDMVKGKVVVE
ncbi:cupredoxin domain-containing protein [Lactobacillus sp. 3B(2020)]|uniref:cupredoxin domain-containing protein n=1 Tax=Lactobacillus sp. 3B(2020) TaxID=2695882 RepID=UPI0015DE1A8A|nr:cupredoxin domain-containing protein [Lactobacillus sp. 3B(2020)]QLL70757.1 cupredoxin domain-containing protein [Lactobacillus sp. 3B(2020)]